METKDNFSLILFRLLLGKNCSLVPLTILFFSSLPLFSVCGIDPSQELKSSYVLCSFCLVFKTPFQESIIWVTQINRHFIEIYEFVS